MDNSTTLDAGDSLTADLLASSIHHNRDHLGRFKYCATVSNISKEAILRGIEIGQQRSLVAAGYAGKTPAHQAACQKIDGLALTCDEVGGAGEEALYEALGDNLEGRSSAVNPEGVGDNERCADAVLLGIGYDVKCVWFNRSANFAVPARLANAQHYIGVRFLNESTIEVYACSTHKTASWQFRRGKATADGKRKSDYYLIPFVQ